MASSTPHSAPVVYATKRQTYRLLVCVCEGASSSIDEVVDGELDAPGEFDYLSPGVRISLFQ